MAFLPWSGVLMWNFLRNKAIQHASNSFERTFGFTGWPGRLQSLLKQDPKLPVPAFYKVLCSSETDMIDFMSEVYCSSWLTCLLSMLYSSQFHILPQMRLCLFNTLYPYTEPKYTFRKIMFQTWYSCGCE